MTRPLRAQRDTVQHEQLLADFRQRMEDLLTTIAAALTKASVADLVEEYVIFHLESFVIPCSVDTLRAAYAPVIARMLRAERQINARGPGLLCIPVSRSGLSHAEQRAY